MMGMRLRKWRALDRRPFHSTWIIFMMGIRFKEWEHLSCEAAEGEEVIGGSGRGGGRTMCVSWCIVRRVALAFKREKREFRTSRK